jgi:hypothetical protein
MPPASNGALSTFGGEDCGLSGVAQGVDGVEKTKACMSWIAVVVIAEIRDPCFVPECHHFR